MCIYVCVSVYVCVYRRVSVCLSVCVCKLTMHFLLQSVQQVCVSDWMPRVTKGCPASLTCL